MAAPRTSPVPDPGYQAPDLRSVRLLSASLSGYVSRVASGDPRAAVAEALAALGRAGGIPDEPHEREVRSGNDLVDAMAQHRRAAVVATLGLVTWAESGRSGTWADHCAAASRDPDPARRPVERLADPARFQEHVIMGRVGALA